MPSRVFFFNPCLVMEERKKNDNRPDPTDDPNTENFGATDHARNLLGKADLAEFFGG